MAAGLLGVAWTLHALVPAIPMLTACVVLGALAGNLPLGAHTGRFRVAMGPGMAYSGKKFMRLGIVLLGLQLSLADVAGLGVIGVLLIIGVVAGAFGGTWLIAKALKMPGDQPVLLATGFSICGASAIGAMSEARGSQKDAPIPVALVTLCGTLAIAALPAANLLLGLDPLDFGRWVGASVHDVGQVVATAQGAGTVALAAAVVVKLVRVLMLAPVTLLGTLSAPKGAHTGKRPPLVPLFVIGFMISIALRTTGLLPEVVLEAGHVAQELLLGAALVGLGFAIDLQLLFRSAGRATTAALAAWGVVAGLGLGAVALFPN